jgi:hypothetical protein
MGRGAKGIGRELSHRGLNQGKKYKYFLKSSNVIYQFILSPQREETNDQVGAWEFDK